MGGDERGVGQRDQRADDERGGHAPQSPTGPAAVYRARPADLAAVYRARPADLAAVLGLVREFCAADRHEFDEDRVARALRPLLRSDEHGQVWLVGAPDGYAVLTWGWSLESGGREALLDEIYVRDRGRGRGGALLEHLVAAAAAAGAGALFLETEAHNERVRGFYRRHGFAAEDSVWMSRALTRPA